MEDIDYKQNCWFLLGPTGIGKTFVSLKLGEQYNNIIVNTDAFSLYKEASIMTAKATKQEQQLVKHKMIDILDLFDINYHQKMFQKDALNEISIIQKNGQIPLVVGGTNYFVECLLFNYINDNNQENINDNYNAIDTIDILNKNMNDNNKLIISNLKQIKLANINNKEICYTKLNEYLNEFLKNNIANKNDIINLLNLLDEKSYNFYNAKDIRRIINAISYIIANDQRKSDILKNQKIKLNFDKTKLVILLPKDIDK